MDDNCAAPREKCDSPRACDEADTCLWLKLHPLIRTQEGVDNRIVNTVPYSNPNRRDR